MSSKAASVAGARKGESSRCSMEVSGLVWRDRQTMKDLEGRCKPVDFFLHVVATGGFRAEE